jgi:hypothetical protein
VWFIWNREQVNGVMVDIDSLFFPPPQIGQQIGHQNCICNGGGRGGLTKGCPYGKINMEMWFQNLEPT